jgi:glycyl-tRNA synthetase
VLHLPPKLAPIKAAVFPLKRNHEGLVALAKDIRKGIQKTGRMRAVYDDTGAIGKLYRRQDEIGTPWCVTVDVESLEDGAATIRDRDAMTQERVPIEGIKRAILDRMDAARGS